MSQPAPVVRATTKSASPTSSRMTAAFGTRIGRGTVTARSGARRRDRVQDRLDEHALVRQPAGIAQHEPVREHRDREAGDVVGDDVGASSSTAWAWAACRSASDARGLAPIAVSLCTRVAFEIATA